MQWGQISPILRFILAFGFFFGLFYWIYLSDFAGENILPALTNFQASIAGFTLDLLGQNTTVDGAYVNGSGFAVNIKKGCDGLEPLAMLLCGILVFPITSRFKWNGLLIGSLVLMLLNQIRIILLYFAGKNSSTETFDWLHLQGGFVIFTTFVVIIWITWANWAMKAEQTTLNLTK